MLTQQEKIFLVATAVTTSAVTVGSVVGGGGGFGGDGAGVTDQVALFEVTEDLPDTTEILSGMGLEVAPDYNLEPVINVEFPSKMAFSIDPFEIMGKGQIFSTGHNIINYSNVDVIVKVKSAHYTFVNDTDFKSYAEPFDSFSQMEEKAVYMLLNSNTEGFKNVVVTNEPREYIGEFYLKASTYDETNSWMNLNEGSQAFMFVNGSASCFPAVQWDSEDVTLTVDFEVEPVIPILPIVDELVSGTGLDPALIISGDGLDIGVINGSGVDIGITSGTGMDVEVTSDGGLDTDVTTPTVPVDTSTPEPVNTEEPINPETEQSPPPIEPSPQVTEPPTEQTPAPSEEPVQEVGVETTPQPTDEPVVEATPEASEEPVVEATPEASEEPVVEATPEASDEPVVEATPEPSDEPIIDVTAEPTSELNI